MCFQETKREHFGLSYIKNFCDRKFNSFAYVPSIGNYGGITIWNDNLFSSTVISKSSFQITIEFKCNISGTIWTITNIYGPAHEEHRAKFIDWFSNIDLSSMKYWMILGDFNLIVTHKTEADPGGIQIICLLSIVTF
jgi:hypothetical protein